MITGRRVVLKLAEAVDFMPLLKIAAECSDWLFWDGGQLSLDNLFSVLLDAAPNTRSYLWSAWQEQEIVGFVSMNDINPVHLNGEIRYLGVKTATQSPWLAADIGCAAAEFGFNTLGLHRIWMKVYGEHTGLCAVLEKRLKVRLEGVQKDAILKQGRWSDFHLFALTRDEWNARKKG